MGDLTVSPTCLAIRKDSLKPFEHTKYDIVFGFLEKAIVYNVTASTEFWLYSGQFEDFEHKLGIKFGILAVLIATAH